MKTRAAFASILALVAVGPAFGLDLVRDGKPVAAIVLPDQATDTEKQAAATLAKYLKMASGADVPVAAESARPGGAAVSIGRTRLAEAAGLSDKDLVFDGYHLRAQDGALYLLGRDTELLKHYGHPTGAQGSMRAVFGLLERFGFRWLQPTPAGVHVPSLKTVVVPDDLNVTHKPQFMYVAGRMYTWGDWSLANSFRKAVRVYSEGGHTWCQAVPLSLWKEHPEYFQMHAGKRIEPVGDNYHLCPSNPDVVRLVTEYTVKKMREGFDLVALGQPDGYQPCECDECRKLDRPGEHHEQVHWLNYQACEGARLPCPDRWVHLLLYGPTVKTSALFPKYPANTMAEVCLTGSMEQAYGGHDAALRFWRERIPGGLTVYVYYMGLYHNVALGPKFTPSAAEDRMRMLVREGVKGIYFCGGGENWGAEGPTYYVIGRVITDPAANWRGLLKEYCDLTFRKAGPAMEQYYRTLHDRLDTHHVRGTFGGGIGDALTAVYTPDLLERMEAMLALADSQAGDDARAKGWIRAARMSYDHVALMTRAFYLYRAYQINPCVENLTQLRDAVKAWKGFVETCAALPKKDPAFLRDFVPGPGLWTDLRGGAHGALKDNFHTLASPFTWDFDALLKAGALPGKTRGKALVARLDNAPVLDGDPSEAAWNPAPWVEVNEVSLGQTEAKTRMRLGYDDKNLYLAFECGEPLFPEMKVVEAGRDGKVYNTECVEVFLAPDGVGQKRVQIVASPTKDGVWDGRYGYIDDPLHPLALSGEPDISWNSNVRHAWKLDADGRKWTIELSLPFSDLGVAAPETGARWRGNFGRERHKRVWDEKKYPNVSEYFLWSPNLQKASFTDAAAFGDLYFGRMPQ